MDQHRKDAQPLELSQTDCKNIVKEQTQHSKNAENATNQLNSIQFEVVVNEARQGQFVCNTCGKAFRFKGMLKQHMERHSIKPIQYMCNDCDAIFLTASHLLQHNCAL